MPATVQRSASAHTSAPQGIAETPSKPRGGKVFSIPAPSGRKILRTPSKANMARLPLESPPQGPQGLEVTPTKPITSSPLDHDVKKSHLAPTPRTLFATPLKRASLHVAESPFNDGGTRGAPTSRTLFATPIRAEPAQVAESPLPAVSTQAEAVEEPSIYDALGWNDDDDFI